MLTQQHIVLCVSCPNTSSESHVQSSDDTESATQLTAVMPKKQICPLKIAVADSLHCAATHTCIAERRLCSAAPRRISEADMQQLTAAARQAKHALSTAQSVSVQLPASLEAPHRHVLVTRKQFEDMSRPLLQRLMDPLDHLAASTKLEWAHSSSEHCSRQMTASKDRFAPPPRRVSDLVLVGGQYAVPLLEV